MIKFVIYYIQQTKSKPDEGTMRGQDIFTSLDSLPSEETSSRFYFQGLREMYNKSALVIFSNALRSSVKENSLSLEGNNIFLILFSANMEKRT